MSDVLRFAIIVLAARSLYSLAAAGLVLVYRGSKVVNFAQGSMGMIAAYVFYEVHQNRHVTLLLAIPVALLSSAAISVDFYLGVIRRLRGASGLIVQVRRKEDRPWRGDRAEL